MISFYSKGELEALGLKCCGDNVLISRKVSIYGAENIAVGDNVRIDDFCILSGNIHIGAHIHIAAYSAIWGKFGVVLHDYAGLSSRVAIYSAMDDFSGEFLIGPIHKPEKRNVTGGQVTVEKFAMIGTNSTVFPNLTLHEGAVVGAHSLVINDMDAWTINVGVPAKKIKDRNMQLLKFVTPPDN
jgi:galactoside O-acetyltransferase